MIGFILNDKKISTDKPTGYLVLDLIRYDKCLTGTKIGCREGDCGACTVLIGELNDGQNSSRSGEMKYRSVTSCLTPIGNVEGKHVVTVEGLNMDELTPVQNFMIEESGTQCGFCTAGFVVSLTGFCLANSSPVYEDAIKSIDGNICRCTGYKSIERAARKVTEALSGKNTNETINWLVTNNFIPPYFKDIPTRVQELEPIVQKTNGSKLVVGGGTDLYVQRPDDLVEKSVTVVASDPNLRFIKVQDQICTLGGATTVTDLEESEEFQNAFPNLWSHIKLVSSSPIRNISTLAGNFVNASPIGDFTAFFLALNAKITLSKMDQNRTIYLKDFYKGYKDLDKAEGEIISSISFELSSEDGHFNFEKVSKRTHLDIASVNTAARIYASENTITSAHISAGGIGPIPTYLSKTGAFLHGKEITPENIKATNEIMQLEIIPISDVRGTANYKRLLLRQLFYAHFIKLFPEEITLAVLS